MKNLVDRLYFSDQKPPDDQDYYVFKIDKAPLKTKDKIYGIFCFFCGSLDLRLSCIEDEGFKGFFIDFWSFYKNLEQKMETENLDYVFCYLWIDEE